MPSDAQKRATERYQKEKVRQQAVKFYPADMDLWEHLQKQPNKMGYVKALIRADMEKEGHTVNESTVIYCKGYEPIYTEHYGKNVPIEDIVLDADAIASTADECDAIPEKIDEWDMAFAAAADGFFNLSRKGDAVTLAPSLYTGHESMTRVGFEQIAAEDGVDVVEAQEKLIAAEKVAGLYQYPTTCSKVVDTAREGLGEAWDELLAVLTAEQFGAVLAAANLAYGKGRAE